MDTATQKEDRRAAIESAHNATRDARERQHVADRQALEATYQDDLLNIRLAKEAALRGVGLNSDGGDPQGRQQV